MCGGIKYAVRGYDATIIMFQDFMLKTALKRALAQVPAVEREKLMTFVLENKEVLGEIAMEVKAEQKNGGTMEDAIKKVVTRRGGELEQLVRSAGILNV